MYKSCSFIYQLQELALDKLAISLTSLRAILTLPLLQSLTLYDVTKSETGKSEEDSESVQVGVCCVCVILMQNNFVTIYLIIMKILIKQ